MPEIERHGRKALKFQALATQMRYSILAGAWPPGSKLPTEAELIDETGLSLTTVRRSFEVLVKEGLVVRRHGAGTFVRDQLPSQPAPRGRAGVLIPDTDTYFARVLQGVEERLTEDRVSLTLATSHYDASRDQAAIQTLLSSGAQGLIVTPTFPTYGGQQGLPWLEVLQRLPVPVVMLERARPELGAADSSEHVVTDHAGGAIDAMQHLMGLGHRRIALVVRDQPQTAPQVIDGYRIACQSERLAQVSIVEKKPRWDAQRATDAMAEILTNDCTAALVFGDPEATLLERAALRQGLEVPEDLALLSYEEE